MPPARPGATRGTQPQSRCIAYRRPPGDVRLRLFCFHHAGVVASLYRSWWESVPGGAGDPDVSREQLNAWRAETEGPFRPRLFPGGHFYLISDPQVVLRELGLELRAAVRRVS
jgi:surfactin synthase thioesterase subunit